MLRYGLSAFLAIAAGSASAGTTTVTAKAAPAPAADATPFHPLDDTSALDKTPDGVAAWNGSFAFGLLASTGNTETGNLSAKADLGYLRDGRDNRFDFSYFDAWARDADPDHKLSISDLLKQDFDAKHYVFGSARYEEDGDAAVKRRFSLSTGVGRHVLSGAQKLDLDIGVGWSHSQDHDADDFDDQAIAVAGAAYRWTINAHSQFEQTAQAEISGDDLYLVSISSLRLQIVADWFVALDYEWRQTRHAPPGIEHSDDIRSVNIGWKFGGTTNGNAPMLAAPADVSDPRKR